MSQTTSLVNPQVLTTPSEDLFISPLYWITRGHGLINIPIDIHLQSWHSAITITAVNPPLCQEPYHCCVSYLTLALSLSSAVPCWPSFLTWFNSLIPTWFNSSFFTWFDSRFLIWFESDFPDSIRLTFNKLIFDLIHIISVLFQSGSRESHIGQGVFKIIQHQNCGKFHNSESSNWFWREHSKRFKKSEARMK